MLEASGAAEEEFVAVHIGAVVVGFGGGLAVVAGADGGGGFWADGDSEAVVEDEEFAVPVGAALI